MNSPLFGFHKHYTIGGRWDLEGLENARPFVSISAVSDVRINSLNNDGCIPAVDIRSAPTYCKEQVNTEPDLEGGFARIFRWTAVAARVVPQPRLCIFVLLQRCPSVGKFHRDK